MAMEMSRTAMVRDFAVGEGKRDQLLAGSERAARFLAIL